MIMASPKSDIIQTIGRIMRQKHENLNPKIIDIVDNFSVFKNQGKKRGVGRKKGIPNLKFSKGFN